MGIRELVKIFETGSMQRHNEVDQWVRNLVLKYNYLPLAYKHDLRKAYPQLYKDIESIKKRALYVLTADTDEAEQYRQAIYRTLTLHAFAYARDIYAIGLITSRVLRNKTTIDKEIEKIRSNMSSVKRECKRFVSDLVVLNFAFVPPEYTFNIIVPWIKKKLKSEIIGATILSLALTEKLPVYSTRDSIMDSAEAEKLVNFAMNARQYAVKIVLERRPRKITDLYALLHAYIEREAENKGLEIMKQLARWGALVESVIVPYYLHHYGFLKIDVASLMLFELRYV